MTKQVKILFAGNVWLKENGGVVFNEKLVDFVKEHDLAWVNLEGSIANSDDLPIEKAGPSLKQDEKIIDILTGVGFNGFCLANNHIWDYGANGFNRVKEQVEDYLFVGAGNSVDEAYEYRVVEINGIKIGFMAVAEWGFGAAEDGGGFAWVNHEVVEGKIKGARKKCDFLVMQVHAGLEEVQFPLPEWRKKYWQMIDWGVDLVVGHHPHVVQPSEIYKNKYIFYSLGNCYFGKNDRGAVLSVVIETGGLVSYKLIPIVSSEGSVDLDEKRVLGLENILENKTYEIDFGIVALRIWNERYKGLYGQVVGRNIWNKIIINKILLLHNLKIETHYWVVLRALSQK